MHDRLTEGVGGQNNGTTDNDRTHYYETVPSNYLETPLWLEADRMGFLLDSLDMAKLNAQRDIVQERAAAERGQPAVRPRRRDRSARRSYPPAHPYSWPVIGSMEDLSAASVEDVKNFFRLYYAPNNATLVDRRRLRSGADEGAGSRSTSATSRAASRSPGPKVAAGRRSTAEKRLVYEDRVQVPRLYIVVADGRRASSDDQLRARRARRTS